MCQKSDYERGRSHGRWTGMMDAWAEVMSYLNTLETNEVSKKEVYHYVSSLRPR